MPKRAGSFCVWGLPVPQAVSKLFSRRRDILWLSLLCMLIAYQPALQQLESMLSPEINYQLTPPHRFKFSCQPSDLEQRSPVLVAKNQYAWRLLPASAVKEAGILPVWARMMAIPLPETTVKMLRLESLLRRSDSVDAKARAKARWAVAHFTQCSYGKRVAELDMRRAQVSAAEFSELNECLEFGLHDPVIQLARHMAAQTGTLCDDDMSALRQEFGEQRLVALAIYLAYAGFQDRLLHALGADDFNEADYQPVAIRDGWSQASHVAPMRTMPDTPYSPPAPQHDWFEHSRTVLGSSEDSRLTIPSIETLRQSRPIFRMSGTVDQLTRVLFFHQPELAQAWFECVGNFRRESRQAPIVEQSVLWMTARLAGSRY